MHHVYFKGVYFIYGNYISLKLIFKKIWDAAKAVLRGNFFCTFKRLYTKMKDLKLMIYVSTLRYKMITLSPRYTEGSKR